ncbi:MAG: hypothetical protein ACK5EU_17620 [Pseudanabaena sp.]|uniref:hypothetical protein n=1 Tax=Pseudanabaena mucicola TaxID=71190 RepID=UPI0025765443|nr:hypothetical protein [Pseudanabaena mucicola]MCA6560079.1 hypothetical protein [Pseudanabaena sp. M079S1SP2A07QC]MCA6574798.1 hypothetical protein [Pseudanabaena sp. M53BS1SP1A06MG]MCA6582753.1 hypothetical protein [Pseudanabaena sp. M34BS1SP1A06MG]MCA6586198.1 hypothetical protein [Pseudanabaena sp. M051S1SP1A06QC]MCA6588677.1 hypothetical protein [Pseudanabaena sp. M109S1SP1A06QC]MCA6591085.1 hypothetical protein [Pseudanabaena sp. M38BS1SP1A06MG]MCA6597917.1 hypothetical protein [Pseud
MNIQDMCGRRFQRGCGVFKLAQEVGQPIKILWDSDRGHLDFQNVNLPSCYAQRALDS